MASLITETICRNAAFCIGPCCAQLCCKCMQGGEVKTVYATRCVLLWLQAATAVLALVLSSRGADWLTTPCGYLKSYGVEPLGVCACSTMSDEDKMGQCWSEQLVWRVEASALAVFALLLLLSISGCGKGAAHSYVGAKFGSVFLLGVISLVVPNDVFGMFGGFASCFSSLLLVVFSVLLMDFGYTWSEVWVGKVTKAERELRFGNRRAWILALHATWLLFFVASCIAGARMWQEAPSDTSKRAVGAALASSFILLLVSILGRIKHGSLLTSTLMMAVSMWLAFEALAAHPGGSLRCPVWASSIVLILALVSMTSAPGPRHASAPSAPLVSEADAEAQSTEPPEGVGSFAKQCFAQIAGSVYAAGALAPQRSLLGFGVHVASIFLVLALYGWSLVAPLACKHRDFGRR